MPLTDSDVNATIARYQAGLPDWSYSSIDLAKLADRIREWIADLWSTLVVPTCRPTVGCPTVLLTFAGDGPRVLGHYRPGRNAAGMRWELAVNPWHLPSRSEMDVAMICLHELLHLLEEDLGASGKPAPKSRRGYHSKWFRSTANELGIPCTSHGRELPIVRGGPFYKWAKGAGLRNKPMVRLPEAELPGRRRQSRAPWICGCPKERRVIVMVPAGSELAAHCDLCGEAFSRSD